MLLLDLSPSEIVECPTICLETISRDEHLTYLNQKELDMSYHRLQQKNEELRSEIDSQKVERKLWEKEKEQLQKTIVLLENENQALKKQIKEHKKFKEKAGKIFQPEQLRRIQDCNRTRWSDMTIQDALQVRYSCGSGYKTLIQMGFPFPCEKTLCRRTQGIKFEPGIQYEMIKMMKIKAEGLNVYERQIGLVFDEMAIAPGYCYNRRTDSFTGKVTLPGHDGIATKGLAFLVVGLSTRFKQVVGYHFSGNSSNGEVYENILMELIHLLEGINLNVNFITSDMGPPNQAFWRKLGLKAGRKVKHVKSSFPNPVDNSRKIFIVPDASHLLKNMRTALISSGGTSGIQLPEKIVEQEGLESRKARVEIIME